VRHSLRQRVQVQIEISDGKNGTDQNDTDDHHQNIGVTGSGDEARQMMGGAWMKCFATPFQNVRYATSGNSDAHSGLAERLYLCTKLELGKLKLAAHHLPVAGLPSSHRRAFDPGDAKATLFAVS
jgi:hypothetical protein